MKNLTPEQKEAQKKWEAITNTLTIQHTDCNKEAQLLNFDELKNLEPDKSYVWIEDLLKNTIKGCQILSNPVKDNNLISIFAGGYYSLLRKNYGKKYQCWTSYPKGKGKISIPIIINENI